MREWPDLMAADWAAMRERFEDRLASAYDPETCSCAWCVSSRDALLALDALARQQEANARLTAILDACAPYLKDDETPVERIERDVKDADALMTVLGQRTKELHNARSNVRVALQEIADRDATIARLREAQAWQPIETAPKEGTDVMLFFRSFGRAYIGVGSFMSFADGSSGWIGASFMSIPKGAWSSLTADAPTHWMPLPLTPAKEADRG